VRSLTFTRTCGRYFRSWTARLPSSSMDASRWRGPGSTVVVQPGTTHAFRNAADRPAHMISRVEAVDDGPWAHLAERGLLLDSTFLQINRTGGLGRVSPIHRCSCSSVATSRAILRVCPRGHGMPSPLWSLPPPESSACTRTTHFSVARGDCPTARWSGPLALARIRSRRPLTAALDFLRTAKWQFTRLTQHQSAQSRHVLQMALQCARTRQSRRRVRTGQFYERL